MVLSKELKDPLRSRAIQTIMKLSAPEHRELMRAFISSIFVGFKPTTAAEHLGSLQRYLKARGNSSSRSVCDPNEQHATALQADEFGLPIADRLGAAKMCRYPFPRVNTPSSWAHRAPAKRPCCEFWRAF